MKNLKKFGIFFTLYFMLERFGICSGLSSLVSKVGNDIKSAVGLSLTYLVPVLGTVGAILVAIKFLSSKQDATDSLFQFGIGYGILWGIKTFVF